MEKAKPARKKRVMNTAYFGIFHPDAKLTDDDVRLARRLRKEGLTYTEITRRIGKVSRQAITNAITGERWRHVYD